MLKSSGASELISRRQDAGLIIRQAGEYDQRDIDVSGGSLALDAR